MWWNFLGVCSAQSGLQCLLNTTWYLKFIENSLSVVYPAYHTETELKSNIRILAGLSKFVPTPLAMKSDVLNDRFNG